MRLVEQKSKRGVEYLVYDGDNKLVSKGDLTNGVRHLLKSKSFDSLAFLFTSVVGFRQTIADVAWGLYDQTDAIAVVRYIKLLAGETV